MAIQVALNHRTTYVYDRPINLGPQTVRLRPAPHCRTPIVSYSLKVEPAEHFVNWQQDPQGNFLARLVFHEKVTRFQVEVDLVAEMTVINPFDFFLEPSAENYSFEYSESALKELKPFLELNPAGPKLTELLGQVDRTPRRTVDFLVDINRMVQERVKYLVRMEPGVQTPEETLELGSGSCRDSAWLLVNALRHLGLAARFCSGYLLQLVPDIKSLDGPSGATEDFTDLHAWTEVFLPGAGWVGLDPTSGLMAGEGHIPLACTPDPSSAAPINGSLDECETTFEHSMTLIRSHEDPRVTKPYTDSQWATIEALGHEVDTHLAAGDVRLTMGGEPTFVSIDDMDSDEWTTAAVGPTKLGMSTQLIHRLKEQFAPEGLLHFGQGKWYPGEPLPRWALACYWRTDGKPVWKDPQLLADPTFDYKSNTDDAQRFARDLADRLQVNADHVTLAFEDMLYYAWRERRLPANVDVRDSKLNSQEERERLARLFEQGITTPTGCILPLEFQETAKKQGWQSGQWRVRSSELFLLPGDSPMGLRLPLDSIIWEAEPVSKAYPMDPMEARVPLPEYHSFQETLEARYAARQGQMRLSEEPVATAVADSYFRGSPGSGSGAGGNGYGDHGHGNGSSSDAPAENYAEAPATSGNTEGETVIRFALCVEPRNGCLFVFMPPVDKLEHYLDLLAAIEATARESETPVVIEGYPPPHDPRMKHLKVTPDPGVIEVNVQPAANWGELLEITNTVYQEARATRLGTEKFDLDGAHTGTGGGNHVVLGGSTPADSPFLRRPDLLASLIAYWHNHPSLSYLFSGKFIGPTSQAPRVDEGRRDATYELQLALDQISSKGENVPPWLVDRVFRHLLVDLTGNTHRAEFCIDKMFSPDSSTGRLGLVEFRGFEMPPHAQMSLTQQLLLRAFVARFWETPYKTKLVDWGSSIHDRFMLPHFVEQDLAECIAETAAAGIAMEAAWFAPHFEFRFPKIGEITREGVRMELRDAIEPWYVLGEEQGGGGTARYVDSSVERMQVKVQGMTSERFVVTCNGRRVPLHPTGTEGEYVAGIRFRAWQPPSCLHPTIKVDGPLVFDLLDTWHSRSLGGCQYHVGNPGGGNSENFPVNALEAESRRAARFFKIGHTPGTMPIPPSEPNARFPLTLDLRRNK